MGSIYFIEGMTCCGKTTCVKGLNEIDMRPILLEHPPRLDFSSDWADHQRRVFEDYMQAFEGAACGKGCVYADFSPFACIPFTRACADVGLIDEALCNTLCTYMCARLNVFCHSNKVYPYRYLSEPLGEIEARLSRRGRRGDDGWDHDLLVAIKKRYDEFFDWGKHLVLGKSGEVVLVVVFRVDNP